MMSGNCDNTMCGHAPEGWSITILENPCVDQRLRSVISIFRVPNRLMEDPKKRDAYVPKIVSLGSYHQKSAELLPMVSHKQRALWRMMTRFNNKHRINRNNMDFSSCALKEIMELQDEIRNNYEEKIEKIDFAMLTLDGSFILEVLRTMGSPRSSEVSDCYDPLFQENKLNYCGLDILNDILKLENQVPLTVLLKLLALEFNPADDVVIKLLEILGPSFLSLFYPFRDVENYKNKWYWPQFGSVREQVHPSLLLLHDLIASQPRHNAERAQEVPHLLGCLYALIVSPPQNNSEHQHHGGYRQLPNEDGDNAITDIRVQRAVRLGNAGIKFMQCNSIKEIKFDEETATIHLPRIIIDDSTEILFRNLLAFEMCKALNGVNYVACYLYLMNQLIDMTEDVDLLSEKNIVTNLLGSNDEVPHIFSGLCKGVTVSLDNVFEQLTVKVDKHYQKRWKCYIPQLRENIISLMAAIVLLLLTVVQTIFSVLSVYK